MLARPCEQSQQHALNAVAYDDLDSSKLPQWFII